MVQPLSITQNNRKVKGNAIKKLILVTAFVLLLIVFYTLDILSFSQVEEIKTFAGGLIFGFYAGSFYIIIGALCGGTLSFYIARFYGKWLHEKLAHEKIINFQKSVKKHGFVMILLVRLVPLVPFNIISYSAGFSTIRYRDFFFATLLGMIPGVLVYANIGAQSLAFGSREFYSAIALLIMLVFISMGLKQWVKKRVEKYEN